MSSKVIYNLKKYDLRISIGSSFQLMKGFRCLVVQIDFQLLWLVWWLQWTKYLHLGKIKLPLHHTPPIYCIVWLELCNIFLLGELLGVIVPFCPWFSHCLLINGCADHVSGGSVIHVSTTSSSIKSAGPMTE